MQTIGEFYFQRRKIVNLEAFFYQGGKWYSTRTGKPEQKGK